MCLCHMKKKRPEKLYSELNTVVTSRDGNGKESLLVKENVSLSCNVYIFYSENHPPPLCGLSVHCHS